MGGWLHVSYNSEDHCTEYLEVPGGRIYKHKERIKTGHSESETISMIFVPEGKKDETATT